MERRDVLTGLGGAALAAAVPAAADAQEITPETVYELRIYHLNEGKLPLILERFRTREIKMFPRFGMHPIAYWTPTEGVLPGDTLVYILRHKSREAARQSWDAFKKDPEWVALKAESEKDGPFVKEYDITFLALTDFSPKI